MHVNELTLLIQGAGTKGIAVKPQTTFAPLGPIPGSIETGENYKSFRPGLFEWLMKG